MRFYARVVNGRVFETIDPFFNNEGQYVPIEERFVPSFVEELIDITDIEPMPAQGWAFDGINFYPYVEPPPTAEEIIASQSGILQQLNQLAAAQKAALTNRIGVINDAIEFEEATQQEIAELPIRQAQLTAWKRYAVLLGRVTSQEGWPPNVIWPEQPADGMDLTVSATRSAQTSF